MFEVREKPRMVETAFLIGVERPEDSAGEAETLLEELVELVGNLGIRVIGQTVVRNREPNPKTFLGRGKTDELIAHSKAIGADCIVFDQSISPAQQRAWEALGQCCVIDREEVILDIFAERAQTREAVLQVELARQEYNLPRLKRAWTHLSRQRGGGVTQRGEGEAQIELDQRLVRDRIARLKKDLATVRKQRATQRKRRQRVPLPTAAIVGYTNAGKSTLLNRLTQASVLSADKLFATLDPTTRQLLLPSGQKLLVTDTVGFVRQLPHGLVEAFKATLEEAVLADFLIHVVDASSPEAEEHRKTTLEVLDELGAGCSRMITVYNKIDRLERATGDAAEGEGREPSPVHPDLLDPLGLFGNSDTERPDLRAPDSEFVCRISAATGAGVDQLLAKMDRFLADTVTPVEMLIPHDRYDIIGRLHENGCVKRERAGEEGVLIEGNVPPRLRSLVEPFTLNRSQHRLARRDDPEAARWSE